MPHQIGHKNLFDNNKSISVKSEDTDSFIKKQNNKNINGVSDTDITTLDPSLGALAPFIDQASGILDVVYGATVEPTQREKDLNMGRAALKFFTQFGAASSVPGQTALGAANIAGASVAQDYLNKVQSDKDKADKLKQAKKAGSLSLGMQLKTAKDAKELAKLKIKPDYINIYKTDKDAQGEKVLNVIKGSADYIEKTQPDGGYTTDKPPAKKDPTVYEDDYGDKRYLTGPNKDELVRDVINESKVDNNELLDGEIENEDETITSNNPKLKRLTKIEMKIVEGYRKEISPLTKDFRGIQAGYQKIMKFYGNRDAVGDYSLAVGYAKLIDPGTAAREGEVTAIQRSGSLPDTVKAQLINALNGKGGLPERIRAGIHNRAIEIFNTERAKALDIVNNYKGLLSADLQDDKQGARLDFFTIDKEADITKMIDLSKIKDKEPFVFNEEKVKKLTVQELTTVLQQELTDPQTQFILKILKEKKKANKQGNN